MNHEQSVGEFNHSGYLTANIVHFGRILRKSGIPVSSQQISGFTEGITQIDIFKRDDFYHTARAFLLHDIEKIDLFNQAFDLFWTHKISAMLEFFVDHSDLEQRTDSQKKDGSTDNNSNSSTSANKYNHLDEQTNNDVVESEVIPYYSPDEILYRKDFSEFDESELRQAKEIIEKIAWDIGQQRTRRKVRAFKQTKYLDFRRTIRNHMNSGGEILKLEWNQKKLKTRPLVVICDISGSMELYSQLFLYFLYGLVHTSRRIESFVFGTRLTRITPALRQKDIDKTFKELSNLVVDWSSGTRIGESIQGFNYNWSRRILGRGAVVLIISDGWDRGDLTLLEIEISRLARTADRLIWLNPLSGSSQYEPLVGGIKTVLPFVDDFLPLNNINSLEEIAIMLETLV
jgi:uncharacterized protein with von Willebrand factor type A (vWA) domain